MLPSTCVTFLVYENMKIWLPHMWGQPHDAPEAPIPVTVKSSGTSITDDAKSAANTVPKLIADQVRKLSR